MHERADLLSYKNIVLLTDGASRSGSAKTATGVVRYRQQDVAAILDRDEVGSTAQQLFGFGSEIPVVGSLGEVPTADALFIGIAPAGGNLPEAWKPILLEALQRGVDVVSGLHDFLVNDPQLVAAARKHDAKLIDVRRNHEKTVADHASFPANNLRIHAVGHDCSVGKMVVTLEVERELQRRGANTRFLATGQTGIMIAGDGVPVDCVVADFISGAVEQMLLRNTDAEIMLVEGQGSISHPSFSGVTMGLLHGCAPQGMILCYEAGRTAVKGLPHVPLKSLSEYVRVYETIAGLRYPSRVIAVAVNGKNLDDAALDEEVRRVQDELGLPACDVYRHGAGVLADAVEKLRTEVLG
ncbi:DUF1611 domain-containing protein [Aeoliella sp.]|uniref:DUF1611 domain-containing protein n=1 Tax=Aeoliella sp. TaxID=2795800 RepID=UPI003CCBFC1E